MKRPVFFFFFVSPAATLVQIAARISEERFPFLYRSLVISLAKSCRLDILKRYREEELKIAVHLMNSGDLNVEQTYCITTFYYYMLIPQKPN